LGEADFAVISKKCNGYRPWVTAPSLLLLTTLLTLLVIMSSSIIMFWPCTSLGDHRLTLAYTLHQPDLMGNSIPFPSKMNSEKCVVEGAV
jgi:hypothetical protein